MEAVLVMMNNYFHDVATALLATSGAMMLFLLTLLKKDPAPDATRFVLALHGGVPFAQFFLRADLRQAGQLLRRRRPAACLERLLLLQQDREAVHRVERGGVPLA